MNSIYSISRRENNIGGIRSVIFAPMKLVNNIPFLSSGFVNGDAIDVTPTPIPGGGESSFNFFKCLFIAQSGRLSWKQREVSEGTSYDIMLEGKISKANLSRFAQWEEFKNTELLVIAVDNNNKGFMLGYIDHHGNKHGARLFVEHSTGIKPDELNLFDLNFKMTSASSALPVYFSIPVVIDPTSADIDVEHDLEIPTD